MVGFVQRQMQHTLRHYRLTWTPHLIETCKTEAMYCYNKYPAYQPSYDVLRMKPIADQCTRSFRDG